MARKWSLADMPEQAGKVALVTGANAGLGLCVARAFARKGAHVVMACRSMPSGEAALAGLRQEVPEAKLDLMQVDVSDMDSVAAFARAFTERHARLDLLVNNAGIAWAPLGRSRQGHEMHFATNFLGPFALTARLLDLMKATPGSRVVNVSSHDHHAGRFVFDDLDWQRRPYESRPAYGNSKVALMAFTLELDRRLRRSGGVPIALAAHPGFTGTDIAYKSNMKMVGSPIGRAMMAIGRHVIQGPEAGAMPLIDAALNPAMTGGEYRGPQSLFGTRGEPGPARISKHAKVEADQARLWDIAQAMSGVTYPKWLA